MALAIFDLDNTLLNGDSDHAWGQFLVDRELVDAAEFAAANDRFYADYKAGCLNIHEYIAFVAGPLQALGKTRQPLREEFLEQAIQPMLQDKAAALLDKHREQGDFLLIITATNSFVTHPIAEKLGVDAILATELEQVDGQYTGRIAGTPCFQAGKIDRLKAWLETQNLGMAGSYFYSDSINDLPLLEVVDRPTVVDGDEKLLAEAAKRGWPVISLRD